MVVTLRWLRRVLNAVSVSDDAEAQLIADQVVAELEALGYNGLRPHVARTRRVLGGNLAFARQPS
jgi:hypothetical protein